MTIFLVNANSPAMAGGGSGSENATLFWNENTSWSGTYLSSFQNWVKFRFGTGQAGNLPAYARPSSIGAAATLTTAVKDGSTETLYVNGQRVLTQTGKLPAVQGGRAVGDLGRGFDDNTYYPGDIAEVLIYDRALSDAERQQVEAYLGRYLDFTTPVGPPGPALSSIWPSGPTPDLSANDNQAVNVGVKFRSDVAGFVTGIRFYKGPFNTGTHTGQLFTSTGTLLAQGVFSGETTTGWQQLNFATPVAIAANSTYVAAYHTTSGGLSYNLNYFLAAGVDTPPLHALRSGVDGANGVYLYGPVPAFPSLSYNATNYWVDVVFTNGALTPTLTSIVPSSGVAGTTVPVTLAGTNLSNAMLNVLTAANVTSSATQINANFVIPVNSNLGPQNIVATSSGGVSNAVPFTILPPAPGISSITPNSGVAGTTVPVTLTGTNLTGATLNLGPGLAANNVTVSGSQITASLVIAANAALGPQNITAATSYGTSNAAVFTIVPPAPVLAPIAPNSGVAGTTVPVTLTGTNLTGATLNLGSGLTANTVIVGATQITANLVIATNAPLGSQNVTVTTAGGTSNAAVFTIVPPAPVLAPIAPNSGVAGTTVPVTLTGTNLTGATLNLGSGLTANTVIVGATQITANLVIATNAPLGSQNVTVTTAGGTSNAAVFTINSVVTPPPVNGATIWPNSAQPTSTGNASPSGVEVGVKFRSDVAGFITGIRFYKGAPNTGTHTGQLWSSTGTLLAQAVFSGETALGWQDVNFATPVPIAANTTYVAAYHSASGSFSYDLNYFAGAGIDNVPLHALRSGVDGGNGVYLYTATPGFPSLSYGAANYWVDVVFSASSSATLASIAPNSGVAGTTVPVTLTGTNLTGATLNLGSGLTANTVIVSATQITANLVIAANAPLGPQRERVRNRCRRNEQHRSLHIDPSSTSQSNHMAEFGGA